MGCTVEFSDSDTRFEFCTRDHKQKTFIDVLLRYIKMDLPHLASILDTPVTKLRDVYYGKTFIAGKPAEELTQLFLVHFGE